MSGLWSLTINTRDKTPAVLRCSAWPASPRTWSLVTEPSADAGARLRVAGVLCRCSTLYFAPGFKTLLIRHQPSCNEPLGYQLWQCFTRTVFIYGSEKIAFDMIIDGLKSPLSDLLKAALATVSADFFSASLFVTLSTVVIFSVRIPFLLVLDDWESPQSRWDCAPVSASLARMPGLCGPHLANDGAGSG